MPSPSCQPNPQSPIRNPQSAIHNPQSPIPHFLLSVPFPGAPPSVGGTICLFCFQRPGCLRS
ncbi:MAG: hypothetical protein DYG98_02075 [Haliscomenobacteraceae bacterium CHB4]|nr:hypothetical protein [Haliscomenobacteraceae bacterium CHB4]